jgi:hypothetical protein
MAYRLNFDSESSLKQSDVTVEQAIEQLAHPVEIERSIEGENQPSREKAFTQETSLAQTSP